MRHAGRLVAVVLLAAAGLVAGTAQAGFAQDCQESGPGKPVADPPALLRLQPKRAWPITQGEGVTVAVIDSGVDTSHPNLSGQVVGGSNFLNDPPGSFDTDCSGHGTAVAGIIAAKEISGVSFYGVAPRAKLLSLRQSDPIGASQEGGGDVVGMAEAIQYAVAQGADVINISVTTTDDDTRLQAAVNNAVAKDVVVVAAAGNENVQNPEQTANATFYPAAYENVLAVAAVGSGDEPSQVSHEGSYVDISAPGENVTSTFPIRGRGEGYAAQDGTSFAAPYVSGVAALVRSRYPDLSATQVMERLTTTADPPVQGEQNIETGAGVVNPYAAVASVLPTATAGTQPPEQAQAPGVPPPPDTTARNVAFASAGTGVLTVVLVVALAVALPRGRVRRWRPGRWHPPPPEDPSASGEDEPTRPVIG
ncbi:MAG: type VII secretion-associated serine protease mycosin [Streptosporangiales bacterium]|nr:type VII secretion-associated serine protease mycosin [Streptosporangiales bacterium]